MNTRLFVDIQFMQTGAFGRGMGQHVRALFKSAVQQQAMVQNICFLYSSNLPAENITVFEAELNALKAPLAYTFSAVDTVAHDLEKEGDYDTAYSHNKQAFENFCESNSDGDDIWFVPCPMQEPVVPALPEAARLRTVVLWYDLMPYLMYGHYFKDPKSPYAHSYLSRMNLLLQYDHILTISDTSKNDLARYLALNPADITNTHGWVNTEISGKGTLPTGVTAPFILLNASPEPNKNAERAIGAFHEFNKQQAGKYQLAITSDYNPRLKETVEKLGANVIFMGHISSQDLKEAYVRSEALLFVSLYEGLGLPPLEAVNFGKKLVLSDIPVHREFGGDDAFYWCDPYDEASISHALDEVVKGGKSLTTHQKAVYRRITQKYSWDVSAAAMWEQMGRIKKLQQPTEHIAVVGPHPNSFSSIGKFVVETLPALARHRVVDYYYDSGPSDRRHGAVRFNYLGESTALRPIQELAAHAEEYGQIIYHMGNSDHHMASYLLAHKLPGTLVLHDTNLSGEGLAGQMLSHGYLSRERVDAERLLETKFLQKPERFISSLLSVQEKVITHSEYAKEVAEDYSIGAHATVRRLEHPLRPVAFSADKSYAKRPLRLGIAGIVTEVKGVNVLDWLFRETNNLANAELYIFGYGFFADKRALFDFAARHSNVHVSFDLTDLEFNNAMSKLDILINYREIYKGEASRATLEAMRERVVPVLRKVGWYDELPDEAVYKLDSIDDMPALIARLAKGGSEIENELIAKVAAGQALLSDKYSPEDYAKGLLAP